MPAKMKKRPDGRYQISVMVGYNADGSPKRKLVYGRTQTEVQAKANDLRMQHNMGLALDSDITVAEWADAWLRTYKSGVEYNTLKMYSFIAAKYVKEPLGGMKLRDVKTAHLQRIVNESADKHWIVTKFRLTVRQMFGQALNNDLIPKNPASGITLPINQQQSRKRSLTDGEVARICGLQMDDRDKCFILVLLYTGMRKSEALALTKDSISEDFAHITVDKTVIFKVNASEIKPNPKTSAGARTIPILAPLKDALRNYVDSIETNLLFPSATGGTMSDTAYRHMWRRFCKAMGTDEITAHIFRHNFATILYNAGVDVKAAQSILGHSSIAVTMDVYTHLGQRNKLEAAEKLNEFLAGEAQAND